ncbi:hypothetical protein [Saccharopolyspora sp. ASAGF58]|uniref:hypothetical protein n=1 Tax=Saccharopolyspora sp. ASAGF58 TaxID=2719023 RepID=UPI0014402DE7|nr:hypothetical protein [Saccharopolyspora sp. ASAGF58]QIZ35942.1 hypothetical protein FDZ84_16140 [Saccharopolyspora sp. ASAGF58]
MGLLEVAVVADHFRERLKVEVCEVVIVVGDRKFKGVAVEVFGAGELTGAVTRPSFFLRQGVEDGYLAPYRLRRVVLSPDADGWEPDPGQLDRFGRAIPEGRYSTRDFERIVRLLARTGLAARHITRLLQRDPTARICILT